MNSLRRRLSAQNEMLIKVIITVSCIPNTEKRIRYDRKKIYIQKEGTIKYFNKELKFAFDTNVLQHCYSDFSESVDNQLNGRYGQRDVVDESHQRHNGT